MDNFDGLLNRVGENLRELRKQKQLTQTELAEKTNRPQSSVARAEAATNEGTSLSLLYDLCQTLGISLTDLFASAEGRSKKQGKTKLTTKWERMRSKVDKMPETDRAWIADVISAVLTDPKRK